MYMCFCLFAPEQCHFWFCVLDYSRKQKIQFVKYFEKKSGILWPEYHGKYLTCKSFVKLGFWCWKEIEHSSGWFPPQCPSRMLELNNMNKYNEWRRVLSESVKCVCVCWRVCWRLAGDTMWWRRGANTSDASHWRVQISTGFAASFSRLEINEFDEVIRHRANLMKPPPALL